MKWEKGMLGLAIALPILGAYGYFVVFSESTGTRLLYLGVKVMMIGLGIFAWRRHAWRLRDALVKEKKEIAAGFALGALCAGTIFLSVWMFWGELLGAKTEVAGKVASLVSLTWFMPIAVVFSVAHAFFEEWYWRGFVVRALERYMRPAYAIILGALAFAGHHIIVLSQMFSWHIVVLGSVGVWCGGVMWGVWRHKTGSLLAPWIAHMCADLAIFYIGFLIISS